MSITAEQMGVIIREQRKNRGLTQQDLAQAAGVSVQAVSKWEIGQSLPDVTLLPDIADCLDLSLEALFGRGEEKRGQVVEAAPIFPNDNKLRVAQFLGVRLLRTDDQPEETPPIPLAIEEALKSGLGENQLRRLDLNVEILGSAHIDGVVQGDVNAGGRVECAGNIEGSVHAGGRLECNGNIEGDAHAGGPLTCGGDIQGDASAGDRLECHGGIHGDASSKGDLICGGHICGDAHR